MFKIRYHKKVIKFLKNQNSDTRKKIFAVLDELKKEPYSKILDIKPLKGFEHQYRLRLGKIRILYCIKDKELLIEVINMGYRGDIYK